MIKCSKYQLLKFINDRSMVENWEIAQEFDLVLEGVTVKLIRLKKRGLVINLKPGFWELTVEGIEVLKLYDKNKKDRRGTYSRA
jgi:predicted transcriptional regulator